MRRGQPTVPPAEAHFSDCTAYRFELVAAGVGGDLAYTVGYEQTSASCTRPAGAVHPARHHAYRREQGGWKIVPVRAASCGSHIADTLCLMRNNW
jgi:hypothetical protein